MRFCVGLLYRDYHPLELSNQPIRLPIFVQKVQLGDLTIEGVTLEDTLGRQAHAYFSIPFAEPPVGPLRFHDPVPKEPAVGTMDATQPGPICMQDTSTFTVEAGGAAFWYASLATVDHKALRLSEDCLHLNVYTPARD